MTVRVPIDAHALKWARENACMEPETLARAAGIGLERFQAIEAGSEQPTYRQAKALAKKCDRTLAFLLAPPPSQTDLPETVDFRGREDSSLTPALAREIRRAEEHRDALLELDEVRSVQELKPITWKNAAACAANFRKLLGLDDSFVPKDSDARLVFNFWRSLLENHGYLVFQTTSIGTDVFKGLSLEHPTTPIILVNGGDYYRSKTYTLFHEVAHLANRTSGVCLLRNSVNQEALANRFAADFLMPKLSMQPFIEMDGEHRDLINAVSQHFRVSTYAAAIRLKTVGRVTQEDLETALANEEEAWELEKSERKQKRKPNAFVPRWRLRYRDLGATYVGAVARAVQEERIDWLQATYLLNEKVPTVASMFDEYERVAGANIE